MTKNDNVWIFNEAALGHGIDGVFSSEYHLPREKLEGNPAALIDSRLWLIVKKGGESFLYAMLTPSLLELYTEGKYKDDYLLYSEPLSSVRFLPRHESRDAWRLSSFPGEGEIRECTENEQTLFHELIARNQRFSFAPPPHAILDEIPKTLFRNLEQAVPDQLSLTLRTIAFGDASSSRSFPENISALGGITLTILKTICPQLEEAEVIRLVAAIDPIARIVNEPQTPSIQETIFSPPPIVDTFLVEIDPEEISPRTFIAKSQNYSSEWLDKTNVAEKSHEKILKDLVLHLKSEEYKVYKTRSFDVFAEKSGVRFLWEIKSVSDSNLVAQGEKGIIQLLRYSTALSGGTLGEVNFRLLLQESEQPAIKQYLSKMAKRGGITLWFYDEQKEWPGRVFSMESEK